ncbi:hypothetical protein PIB30_010481 [Stylosanthes scabra]|uniref:Uncharacterized protein n=1 Tax=Stylosanthes scabra TaxID=79078 RepID=A0ABU6Z573_9FABA|nr:hypothetical protein [Stylosanthes scabra]
MFFGCSSYGIIFEELKNVICQNVEPNAMKIVKSILYRRPVLVFGGFIQFQKMSTMDDVSLQQMISIHLENMAHVSVIELYVEFKQISYVVGGVKEVQPDLAFEGYYSDSEEEFEGNYEIQDANEEDVLKHDMESDVEDVANALANELVLNPCNMDSSNRIKTKHLRSPTVSFWIRSASTSSDPIFSKIC